MSATRNSKSPLTRRTLLLRLRDREDASAWTEFVEIYGPLIYAYSRNRGLQDADAADVTQDVLATVSKHMNRFDYDDSKGTFRGWLFTITRNKIINAAEKAKRKAKATGSTEVGLLLANQPAREEAEFQRQCDWQLFLQAADRVRVDFRENTWDAFWGNVVEGSSAKKVAVKLKISVGAVYIAKSRVLQAIREQLELRGEA